MLHELRFYEIVAGRLAGYIDHAGAVAVPFRGDRYGKLLGFWSCEIGAVNCVFNLREHENVATREALRADLQQQDVWRNEYLPHSHVPYKSAGAFMTDLAAGRLSFVFATIPAYCPFITSGRVKAVAVMRAKTSGTCGNPRARGRGSPRKSR